jgi:hypothetical protein
MHEAPDLRTVDNRLQARISELFFCKAAHRPQAISDGHAVRDVHRP